MESGGQRLLILFFVSFLNIIITWQFIDSKNYSSNVHIAFDRELKVLHGTCGQKTIWHLFRIRTIEVTL